MDNQRNRTGNAALWMVLAFFVAIVADIILVFVLKDRSPLHRWLWLPLVGFALSGGAALIIDANRENFKENLLANVLARILSWAAMIWGVVRGIIVIVADFKSLTDFWVIVGAVFLCLFMFVLNAAPIVICGGLVSGAVTGTVAAPEVQQRAQRNSGSSASGSRPVTRVERPSATSSRSRQGNLTDYFSSYSCSPQAGTMYFWKSGPRMTSDFGSHSEYTVEGTLGITEQSVETFHVTSADRLCYLDSVKREIDAYICEVVRNYRRDYPEDGTEFNVHISINVTVVDP